MKWTDKGGGGLGIWGAVTGDMWTANGAHLVNGKWVPLAGTSNGIFQTIGTSATSLFFLGFAPSTPKSYYEQGNAVAPSAFPGVRDSSQPTQAGPAWPVSPTDYWVGTLHSVYSPLSHGDPTGAPQLFTEKGPNFDQFSKYVDQDPYQYDCENDVLYRTRPSRMHIPGGPECWLAFVQTDADGRIWLASDYEPRGLWIYDSTWHSVPLPSNSEHFNDFQVRGHEAWLLESTDLVGNQLAAAYRFNGHGWDTYRLGAYNSGDARNVCITSDEQVYFGAPDQYRRCVAQLIFEP
jgi:hypothetical protein